MLPVTLSVLSPRPRPTPYLDKLYTCIIVVTNNCCYFKEAVLHTGYMNHLTKPLKIQQLKKTVTLSLCSASIKNGKSLVCLTLSNLFSICIFVALFLTQIKFNSNRFFIYGFYLCFPCVTSSVRLSLQVNTESAWRHLRSTYRSRDSCRATCSLLEILGMAEKLTFSN